MKKLHKLIKYALELVNELQLEQIERKQQAFAVVRCRLEEERYIR